MKLTQTVTASDSWKTDVSVCPAVIVAVIAAELGFYNPNNALVRICTAIQHTFLSTYIVHLSACNAMLRICTHIYLHI